MNIQQIAQVNSTWTQAPLFTRTTSLFLITVLFAVVLSISLVYFIVGGIALLLR